MTSAKRTLALVCAFAAAMGGAPFSATAETATAWSWTCDSGASISGSTLTISLPSGGSATAYASAPLNISSYLGRNSGALFTIRARGENVVANDAYGARATIRGIDATVGSTVYYTAQFPSGTFGWTNITLHVNWMAGAALSNGLATIALGLQNSGGTVVFDLASCTLEAEVLGIGAAPSGFTVEYPAALPDAPLRGFNSPVRAMTEDDIETLATWGARLVRFQICRDFGSIGGNDDFAEYTQWIDSRLDNLVDVLGWAEDRGMKVCVDLHVIPGGFRGVSSPEELAACHDETFATQYVETWRRIARRVARHPALYGYDLVNEPKQRGPAPCSFLELQRRAAAAVRAIDPVTPLVVEACRAASPLAYEFMPPLDLDNVIYEIHAYAPSDYSFLGVGSRPRLPAAVWPDAARGWDEAYLRRYLEHVRAFQLKYGARILVGEFSAVAWAPGAENYLRDLTDLFEEYGWDWTYFAYRDWPSWDIDRVGEVAEALSFDTSNPRMAVLLDALRRTQWFATSPATGTDGGAWKPFIPASRGDTVPPSWRVDASSAFAASTSREGHVRVEADLSPADGIPASRLPEALATAIAQGVPAAVAFAEEDSGASLALYGLVAESGSPVWRRLDGFGVLPGDPCRVLVELASTGATTRVRYSVPPSRSAWCDAAASVETVTGAVAFGGAAALASLSATAAPLETPVDFDDAAFIPGGGYTNATDTISWANWFSATVENGAPAVAGGTWGAIPAVTDGAYVPATGATVFFRASKPRDGLVRIGADIAPGDGWPRARLLALRDQAVREGVQAAVVFVEDGDDGTLAPFGLVRDAFGLASWRRLKGLAPLAFEHCRVAAEIDYSGETPHVSYLACLLPEGDGGASCPDELLVRLRDSSGAAWFGTPVSASQLAGNVAVGGAASVSSLRGFRACRPILERRTVLFFH